MEEKLKEFKALIHEIQDIYHSISLLGWDQQTYMPEGGAEDRSCHLATLSKIAHEKFACDEIGQLLEELKKYADTLPPDGDDARLIKVVNRDYEKQIKVPAELVAKFAKTTAITQQVWEKARGKSDFAMFKPHLQQVIDLRIEYANIFTPFDHVYDPLLDDFEPGLKTADVQAIFDQLRPSQVELIKAIKAQKQVDDSFLHQQFDEQKQWDFGVEVMSKFGFDWQHGRQDKSAHPFTESFGIGDVRVTTRIYPDFLNSSLFSSMHECGHALYEQGIDKKLARTPLGGGASLAVHESQSRLWENLVGRSLDFWSCFYPRLQELYPGELGNIDLQTFYSGINKVEPSLIRVEADEVTYNLHIMLRLELEIALISEQLKVDELPDIWRAKMKDYLGVVPENNAKGVLQDVHWSIGAIGYFSTYALGNLISAQIWECINRDIPDLPQQVKKANFAELLAWLRDKIHCHGAKFEPQELIKKITGSKITAEPFLRYLKNKFGEIYGL